MIRYGVGVRALVGATVLPISNRPEWRVVISSVLHQTFLCSLSPSRLLLSSPSSSAYLPVHFLITTNLCSPHSTANILSKTTMNNNNNMNNKGESSDAPANRPNNAPHLHDYDAPHRTARLLTSMPIRRDTSLRDALAAHMAFVPIGTLGEADVAEELLRGHLFVSWVVTPRLSLTRNDLQIAEQRP